MEFVVVILPFLFQSAIIRKIHDILYCSRIENEKLLKLFFQIAFGWKWRISLERISMIFFTKVLKIKKLQHYLELSVIILKINYLITNFLVAVFPSSEILTI